MGIKKFSPFYQFPNLSLDNRLVNQQKEANISCIYVSEFFPIKTGVARHPISHYQDYFDKLVKMITDPIYIFIPEESLKEFNFNTKGNSNIHFLTKYNSAWEVGDMKQYKEKYYTIEKNMQKVEKYKISAEIGVIWNVKAYLAREIAIEFQNVATYLFWIDFGKFRQEDLLNYKFPSHQRISKLFNSSFTENRIMFPQMPKWKRNYKKFLMKYKYPVVPFEEIHINDYHICMGNLYGGRIDTMIKFVNIYFDYHHNFTNREQFVLLDEYIHSSVCLYHPDMCMFIDIQNTHYHTFWDSPILFYLDDNYFETENSIHHFELEDKLIVRRTTHLDSWK